MKLQKENAQLRQDPKAILVDNGYILANTDTLQTLTQDHTKTSLNTLNEEDISFWNSIIDEETSQSLQKIPTLLKVKIRAGIPPPLRSQIWSKMAASNTKAYEQIYPNLLKEESSSDRIIKRDIPRTFPKLDMFKDEGGPGQKSLYNLLKAYSVFDPNCGYCQGLSFVVAPLLLQNVS
jgi:hypothetical protein